MSKSVKKQPVECCTNPVVKLFTGKLSIQSTGDTGVNSSTNTVGVLMTEKWQLQLSDYQKLHIVYYKYLRYIIFTVFADDSLSTKVTD